MNMEQEKALSKKDRPTWNFSQNQTAPTVIVKRAALSRLRQYERGLTKMKASVNLSISVCLKSACGLSVWLPLPATEAQFMDALKGVLSMNGNSFLIAGYSNTVPGLSNDLLMSENIQFANYLAARLEKLSHHQICKLVGLMESGLNFNTLTEFIDFTFNDGCIALLPNVRSVEDLGRYYLYDSGYVKMPDTLKKYVGLAMFGINAAEAEGGAFTSQGYLSFSGKKWKEVAAQKGVPEKFMLPVTELNYIGARPGSIPSKPFEEDMSENNG